MAAAARSGAAHQPGRAGGEMADRQHRRRDGGPDDDHRLPRVIPPRPRLLPLGSCDRRRRDRGDVGLRADRVHAVGASDAARACRRSDARRAAHRHRDARVAATTVGPRRVRPGVRLGLRSHDDRPAGTARRLRRSPGLRPRQRRAGDAHRRRAHRRTCHRGRAHRVDRWLRRDARRRDGVLGDRRDRTAARRRTRPSVIDASAHPCGGARGMTLDLDPADLSRAVGRPVTSYDVEPIDPHLRIHSVTGGVYRVSGDGFSLVVKVVRHGTGATPDGLWGADAEEHGRNYWKREWLAFDSGLLEHLPGRLRAPRTLLTTQRTPDECWIWLEDVAGRTGRSLRLDDFPTISYALGTTQGAYAAGRAALPPHLWLSRDWLRGWVDACAHFLDELDDDARWDDPLLDAVRPLRRRVAALWQAREELLSITGAAPQTITHWDFWPANIYAADADVVAIDWSQIGISGVSHDLDQLTLDTVWMLVRPDDDLDVLEGHVLPAYLSGLRDGGLDVSMSELRRWYAAAAAVRYSWLAGGQPDVVGDPVIRHAQQQRFGVDIAAIARAKGRVIARAVALGEWALESSA